jgi:hypothetical protein
VIRTGFGSILVGADDLSTIAGGEGLENAVDLAVEVIDSGIAVGELDG